MASLSHGHLDIITNNHHFFCFSQFVKPKVCEAVHSGVKIFLNLNPNVFLLFQVLDELQEIPAKANSKGFEQSQS